MTNEEILSYLKTQGFLPQVAQEPSDHIRADESSKLPKVDTSPDRFQPQPLNDPTSALANLAGENQAKLPVPPVKPWQPPAQKNGATPQMDELIALSKAEPSLKFTDTSMNFQQAGLIVRQRSEAVDRVQKTVAEAGAAVNRVADSINSAVAKRQRESGEWPDGFTAFGDMRRCDACNRGFWSAKAAWKHVQKVCPERARIARALAEYRPCTNALP
ncbi:MAG TPA: hypothetical protein VKW70_07300 [Terriglobia bacterium]|nr:hypothetical protein [Terriglobia bacterium]